MGGMAELFRFKVVICLLEHLADPEVILERSFSTRTSLFSLQTAVFFACKIRFRVNSRLISSRIVDLQGSLGRNLALATETCRW